MILKRVCSGEVSISLKECFVSFSNRYKISFVFSSAIHGEVIQRKTE